MSDDAAPAADYGIDAPGVIRNLLVLGGACVIAGALIAFSGWSGVIAIPPSGHPIVRLRLNALTAFSSGFAMGGMALWMLWTSKVGKSRRSETLLDEIDWSGTERVLDIGCGRGLLLIAAAKRLTSGKATGIDIWQEQDLSGNRIEAVLENARRENVSDRIEVQTMDMRQLHFADATFDLIVSSNAIHNIYARKERAAAIREIARVLKPGGIALIDDIRHHRSYAATFSQQNCPDIRWLGSPVTAAFLFVVTCASLHPRTLLVRKSGGIQADGFSQ